MNLNSNILKLQLYQICQAGNFAMPILVMIYLHHGLSILQIGSLVTINSLIVFFFDIPTGAFADKLGRKFSMMLASIFLFGRFAFLFFADSYLFFALAAASYGFSNAFYSGSHSAFLYDTLKNLKREDEYKKIRGRQFAFTMWTLATACLIGGFLAGIDTKIPIIISVCFALLQLIIGFSLTEPKYHKKSSTAITHTLEALKFSWNHKKTLYIIIISMVIIGINDGIYGLWQPYFNSLGIDITYFGIIYSIALVGAGFLAKYASKIEQRFGAENCILLISICFCGLFTALFFPLGLFGLAAFFLQDILYGFTIPLIEDYQNRHIESSMRATVLSIQSFAQKLLAAILLPIIGFIMDFSINYGFLFIAIVSFVILAYPMKKLVMN
jgi:MFS family permease